MIHSPRGRLLWISQRARGRRGLPLQTQLWHHLQSMSTLTQVWSLLSGVARVGQGLCLVLGRICLIWQKMLDNFGWQGLQRRVVVGIEPKIGPCHWSSILSTLAGSPVKQQRLGLHSLIDYFRMDVYLRVNQTKMLSLEVGKSHTNIFMFYR